jgi:hypothetical protein
MICRPEVVVRFQLKPVVGFSCNLTVITAPVFTFTVAPFCSSVTTRWFTGTAVPEGVGSVGGKNNFPIVSLSDPTHPVHATVMMQMIPKLITTLN